MKLVIVYLLIALAFCYKSHGSHIMQEEYGVSDPLISLDYETKAADCTGVTGTICSDDPADCGNSYMCIGPGAKPIRINCKDEETCNNGMCSNTTSPLCEYKTLEFKCSTEGMYPEPSSCKKYNYCLPDTPGGSRVNPAPIQGTCPQGWGYNPANTFCDKKLINNNCADTDRAVPKCKEVGQNAALATNPVLYYICLPYSDADDTLYPLILKCPDNQKYAGNLQCK